jgi:DNA invertase Pin-like site-specific DNA recombinase
MTVRALPRSLEDLRGRRAARWIRESTAGQADNFGPDAQLEQQSRAIERWGLLDTGGAWQVAHSGRTIAATGQWAEMLAGAGEDWEVLVVGYVSRFARDLRTAVNARHDLHARGAVILFADERVLSSDEDEWERWAREAVEAEAYSRRLAKRIREGYAAKRRRLGVPGGNRAPLGTIRDGRTIVIDEASLAIVRRTYELAAAGRTDREVGAAMGLALKHVAEILTNPFYAGRLWSGEPSALGALVDPATWEHVQSLRARYSRRHRGSVNRRQYGLGGLLACAACGRHLTGHVGRYRHQDACQAFRAAAPRRIQRDGATIDPRVRGESYKVEMYEQAIGRAFEHVAVSTRLKTDTVGIARRADPDGGDVLTQARIKRERERAALQFAKDRDLGRLEATMTRLDAEAQAAVVRPSRIPTAAEARAYLESLPELWAKTSDAGRHAIAEAVFERIDVLGVTDYTFTLTAHAKARGWDAAFGPGVLRVGELEWPTCNHMILPSAPDSGTSSHSRSGSTCSVRDRPRSRRIGSAQLALPDRPAPRPAAHPFASSTSGLPAP